MTLRDSWRLKLLLVTLATLLTGALAFAGGELAVRYRERHRSTVPGSMPSLFYRHARLGHALIRDQDYFGWVHVGPEGFRGARSVPVAKPTGVYRILAVGGSTTFDTFVSSDSAAWPARLESRLAQLTPPLNVEVLNAGVPGYVVGQDLTRLEIELHRYQPDLIILYQGHNDLYAFLAGGGTVGQPGGRRPNEVSRISPWVGWLEDHSVLYAKLAELLKARRVGRQARRTSPTEKPRSAGLSGGASEFAIQVSFYLSAAKSLGVPVVIPGVVHVSGSALTESNPEIRRTWQAAVPYASPDSVLAGYRLFNQALREAAARYGAVFLETQDMGIEGTAFYVPEDPIHFNDRGADRFAEGLARKLLETGVIPRPSSPVSAVGIR